MRKFFSKVGAFLFVAMIGSAIPSAGFAAGAAAAVSLAPQQPGPDDPPLPPNDPPNDPPAQPPLPPIEFVDERLPSHANIAPGDFTDVLSRVKLYRQMLSESDVTAMLESLDVATSAEEAVSVLPPSMRDQPELVSMIQTGLLPPPPSQPAVFTGEYVPPTPAAGAALLPGFPPPYGYYTPNPTNNWGMPNAITGGCGPFIIRGDGAYFDFRRACRQHDLGYRWTPVGRLSVDGRLLTEMLYDCSLRSPVTRALCSIRSGVYYAAVVAFGGPSYGNNPTAGYNGPGTPIVFGPTTSCAQASHAFVFTDGFGNRVPRNKPIYFTGVVRQHTRVRFQLIDANGNVALQHMTHASRTNCVIHHEPERVPASVLANGVYQIRILFTPWETEQVTEQTIGSIEVFAPTGSTTCNQNSHAWVHGAGGPIWPGTTIYPTGVVRRNTPIYFSFVPRAGGAGYSHATRASRDNCVVHHEPEARSTAGWTPGLYDILATYTEWETDTSVTRPAGVLDLRTSGGGGGGECLLPDPTSCPQATEDPTLR